jgi:hypothetical protein
MKRSTAVLLLGVALCTGCSTHYRVTLNNGSYYTAVGKPRLDKTINRYVFTDVVGQHREVSPLLIRVIAPESMRDPDSSNFYVKPAK